MSEGWRELDERRRLLHLKMSCKSLVTDRNSFLEELGVQVLLYAAQFDNLHLLELALEGGVHPDCNLKWPWTDITALCCAVLSGNLEILQALLRAGASPSARGGFRETPLFLAIRENRLEVVRALLNARADANAVTANGATALHFAKEPELIQLLVAAGANPNIPDLLRKRVPLQWASYGAQVSQVIGLLEVGANPDAQDQGGRTPLHAAVITILSDSSKKIEIIKALLNKGANRFIKDKFGNTALDIAYLHRFWEAVEILGSDDSVFPQS